MICNKNKCTGCFACYNICPKKAIDMVEDDNGFIYPQINTNKCINCGLCKKVCPALNEIESAKPQKSYAMQMADLNKLKESTSGGAATIFSEYILENDGIVYGAAFEKGFKINHIRIDKKEDLAKIKGSKYVHCYINDTYKNIKKDLTNDKKVLFIGTPCQVAGLKKYLMKDYDKLYCVDIICHGVPSQKYLKEELSEEINIEEIDSLQFRIDDEFKIIAKNNNIAILEKEMCNSNYYQGFMDGFLYRENCYNCKYASSKRISDVTIGDYWGIGENCFLYTNRKKGLSVLLPITKKGIELIENCKTKMKIEERTVEEAIKGNTQLRESSHKNKKYDKFKKDYLKYGFEKAYKKNRKLKILKRNLKNNKLIYNTYKKLKGSNK